MLNTAAPFLLGSEGLGDGELRKQGKLGNWWEGGCGCLTVTWSWNLGVWPIQLDGPPPEPGWPKWGALGIIPFTLTCFWSSSCWPKASWRVQGRPGLEITAGTQNSAPATQRSSFSWGMRLRAPDPALGQCGHGADRLQSLRPWPACRSREVSAQLSF